MSVSGTLVLYPDTLVYPGIFMPQVDRRNPLLWALLGAWATTACIPAVVARPFFRAADMSEVGVFDGNGKNNS